MSRCKLSFKFNLPMPAPLTSWPRVRFWKRVAEPRLITVSSFSSALRAARLKIPDRGAKFGTTGLVRKSICTDAKRCQGRAQHDLSPSITARVPRALDENVYFE